MIQNSDSDDRGPNAGSGLLGGIQVAAPRSLGRNTRRMELVSIRIRALDTIRARDSADVNTALAAVVAVEEAETGNHNTAPPNSNPGEPEKPAQTDHDNH